MAKNSPTIRMLLVSVLAMIAVSEVTADHKHAHKVVSKLIYGLANAAPNEIAGISLTNPRYWRTAIFLHLLPKIIYYRLTKKYKKQHKKNERIRKKYRTIVPVSIVPQLLYMRAYNREKNSLYYFVGADDAAGHGNKPQKPGIPMPEIPEETKEAYEKGVALEEAAKEKEATMIHNTYMAEKNIIDEALMSEGAAKSKAEFKNHQSVLDVENEIKQLSENNKIEIMNY